MIVDVVALNLNLVKSTHLLQLTLSSVLLASRAADWVTIVTEDLQQQCLAMITFVHHHEPLSVILPK